jgi:hypothetical protein
MSLTWSLDKADGVYAPGAQATLTVTSNKRISTATIAITTGGEGANATLTVQDGVVITDSTGRKWTLVTDNGSTAIFTATA